MQANVRKTAQLVHDDDQQNKRRAYSLQLPCTGMRRSRLFTPPRAERDLVLPPRPYDVGIQSSAERASRAAYQLVTQARPLAVALPPG